MGSCIWTEQCALFGRWLLSFAIFPSLSLSTCVKIASFLVLSRTHCIPYTVHRSLPDKFVSGSWWIRVMLLWTFTCKFLCRLFSCLCHLKTAFCDIFVTSSWCDSLRAVSWLTGYLISCKDEHLMRPWKTYCLSYGFYCCDEYQDQKQPEE